MTAIITLVIVGACVAYRYLKGTFFRAVITTFTVISAGIVAFAFFEKVADLMISRSESTSAMMGYWQPIALAVLFMFSFAVLQAAACKLARKDIAVGPLVEKIGRVVFAAVYGLLLSGILLTALGMAPLPKNLPYKRFQSPGADPYKPAKASPNTDGLVTGIFGTVSRGSLSGQASFTALHPSFINELYLNRLAGDIPLTTPENAIEVAAKDAAWLAPQEIKDAENNPVSPRPGYDLTVVRVGINNSVKDFTLSQFRLICNGDNEPLEGSAVDAYPVGYFVGTDKIALKKLGEKISTSAGKTQGRVKYIDLVFNVPNNMVPRFVAFRNNSIAPVPKLTNTEEAPAPQPF